MVFIRFLSTTFCCFSHGNGFYLPSMRHFSLLLSLKWLLFAFYTPFLLTFFSKMAFIRHLSTISPCPSLKNGFYFTSINHFSSLLSPKWLLFTSYEPFPLASFSKMAFTLLLSTTPPLILPTKRLLSIQPLSATLKQFFPKIALFLHHI